MQMFSKIFENAIRFPKAQIPLPDKERGLVLKILHPPDPAFNR